MSGLVEELERLLRELVLIPGKPYAKGELLEVLGRTRSDTAESDFSEIQQIVLAGGRVGDVTVKTTGVRRGMRYVFGVGEVQSNEEPIRRLPRPSRPAASTLSPVSIERSGAIQIHAGDNLPVLRGLKGGAINLIYVDPPFNTGKSQARTQIRTERDDRGDRTGFQGKRYRTTKIGTRAFADRFDDYIEFLEPRLVEAHRVLAGDGSLFLHLDYREVHYAKVLLDEIFGRECFINEIIWAYDYGARSTSKWSAKHDNILWYAKDPSRYCWNFDEMDRIPYMAPDLVGEEKAARGKTPTDTWWHTIVSPNGREKTGYPTQKPLGVINRIVKVHSRPGDTLLDFFAGSGTLGEAGATLGRDVILIDNNPEAIAVMTRRLERFAPTLVESEEPISKHMSKQVGSTATATDSNSSAHARCMHTVSRDILKNGQASLF
ncbi:MAG: site-specific DNA-methyltransferase [Polyangiaceae bacterium]|nr:site-specific DNA-methyltransferase [Polyangiaceae bacterium]